MKSSILITGNEVLSGQVTENNATYLARELSKMGIELISIAVLPDNIQTIANHVRKNHKKVNYFFVSGGIGGTHDDVTRPAIAKAIGKRLALHPEFFSILKKYYKHRLNAARKRMAMIPEGAKLIIPRKYPQAPGFQVRNIYVFAGIPELMRDMFATVKETIKKIPSYQSVVPTKHREGDFADELTRIAKQNPNVQIGSYPYFWKKQLGGRIVLKSKNKSVLKKAVREVRKMLANV